MNKKLVSILRIALFLGIGFFLLWLVLRNQDLNQIKSNLLDADWTWAIYSMIAAFASNVFRALRWNMLIHPLGYRPRVTNTFCALMIGYFSNLAVPRLGEVSRCAVMNQYEKIPVNKLFGTVVTERIIDVLTIFLLLLVVVLLEFDKMSAFSVEYVFKPMGETFNKFFSQGFVFYLVVLTSFAAVLFISWFFIVRVRRSKYYLKLSDMIRGFVTGLKTIGHLRNRNLFLIYTVLIWFLYFLMSYFCFFSFPGTSHLGWVAGLAVMVMGGFGFAAPVPGGIGAFEFMVTGTLILYGIDKDVRDSYALFVHAVQWIAVVVFGLLSFVILPLTNRNTKS